jgi:predicted lipid-binding transport protein (Tim44 family)
MAKIKITADTKDAQKKIKDLSKNVDSLHKQSEKPLKVRAGAQNRRGSTSDSGKRTITRTESANDGSKNGVAKGAFLGGLGGGIAGVVLQNIPLIVSLVGKAFDGITAAFNFSTNLQGLGETIRKYMELGDAITNPAKGALQRIGDPVAFADVYWRLARGNGGRHQNGDPCGADRFYAGGGAGEGFPHAVSP